MRDHMDVHKSDTSSPDGSEPIYEGEDRILHSGIRIIILSMYEGEVILVNKHLEKAMHESHANNDVTHHNGPKERELCVFFRNNHFTTMFKFKGELYLLALDQGMSNAYYPIEFQLGALRLPQFFNLRLCGMHEVGFQNMACCRGLKHHFGYMSSTLNPRFLLRYPHIESSRE
ncbi:hypothetical protein IFM89_039979 [Coptis chinensis]|uniref:MINDY deubiquitinase domain-containing protein n=1 Tax=Coptis chinensis TaxID=261450 RepID=A0A835GUS1_9MAGN|nr:hypothetical protein IFM89_039979 [Coptis chinensis]